MGYYGTIPDCMYYYIFSSKYELCGRNYAQSGLQEHKGIGAGPAGFNARMRTTDNTASLNIVNKEFHDTCGINLARV